MNILLAALIFLLFLCSLCQWAFCDQCAFCRMFFMCYADMPLCHQLVPFWYGTKYLLKCVLVRRALKFHRICKRSRGKSLQSLDRTSFALGVKSTSCRFPLLLRMYFQFLQLPSVSLEKAPNHRGTRAWGKRLNRHRSGGSWTRTALCPRHIAPLLGKQPWRQKFSYQKCH